MVVIVFAGRCVWRGCRFQGWPRAITTEHLQYDGCCRTTLVGALLPAPRVGGNDDRRRGLRSLTAMVDQWGWSRTRAVGRRHRRLPSSSLPCVFGFNIWSFLQPLGEGSGMIDLWDFIVSFLLLPIGSLIFALFCAHRTGWGWDNFLKEANSGEGLKFPSGLRFFRRHPADHNRAGAGYRYHGEVLAAVLPLLGLVVHVTQRGRRKPPSFFVQLNASQQKC